MKLIIEMKFNYKQYFSKNNLMFFKFKFIFISQNLKNFYIFLKKKLI